MRALGLDVGSKTIGVAISDTEGVMAHAREVLRREGHVSDAARISALASELDAEVIVVGLPLELDGISVGQARQEAVAALARVGIDQQLDRYPDSFSGGQQQRIAIARSVVGDRRVVFADEPTGALDTLTSDQVVEVLAALARNGTAVVMVTHEPRFASWADRVVFLRDGRIVDDTSAAVPTGAR